MEITDINNRVKYSKYIISHILNDSGEWEEVGLTHNDFIGCELVEDIIKSMYKISFDIFAIQWHSSKSKEYNIYKGEIILEEKAEIRQREKTATSSDIEENISYEDKGGGCKLYGKPEIYTILRTVTIDNIKYRIVKDGDTEKRIKCSESCIVYRWTIG